MSQCISLPLECVPLYHLMYVEIKQEIFNQTKSSYTWDLNKKMPDVASMDVFISD